MKLFISKFQVLLKNHIAPIENSLLIGTLRKISSYYTNCMQKVVKVQLKNFPDDWDTTDKLISYLISVNEAIIDFEKN